MGSQFPAPPALDWSSTNPHAPSPGHVNPGCGPRDPRWLAMECQSTWFQAWWLWVWPRFEPLTPSPWFIRWRLSLSPLSHSLCQLQVYAGVANANTTTRKPWQFQNIHLNYRLPDACITRPTTDLTFIAREYLVIQCVSVDSASFVIYPEPKATEVSLSALKWYLCSFYFRINNEPGWIHRNTLYL